MSVSVSVKLYEPCLADLEGVDILVSSILLVSYTFCLLFSLIPLALREQCCIKLVTTITIISIFGT